MSLQKPQQIIENNFQNFSFEVATLVTCWKNFNSFLGFNVISEPKTDLLTLKLLHKENSINEIAKIIIAMEDRNYELIMKRIYDLYTIENFEDVFFIADELEKAFNVARFVITEPIVKLRIEELQQDLFKIKLMAANLQFSSNKEDKQRLSQLIDEVLKKLQTSNYTRNLIKSLGIDEKTLMKKIEQTKTEFK